jgi:hypothetical protein
MIKSFIAPALLFGAALVAQPAFAKTAPSADPCKDMACWKYYGADHAYPTKAAAFADAANVFHRAGWPPKAVAAMVEKMKTQAMRIELRKGDRLDFMRSGASALWRNVLADFIPPPGKGVSVVVSADSWTVTVDGVVYEAILPDVCNNLAGRVRRTESPCRLINMETRVGQETYIHWRYESDDDCWGYREVSTIGQPEGVGAAFTKPDPHCPNGPCNFIRVDSVAEPVRFGLMGSVRVTPGMHQFRVSKKFFEDCIEFDATGSPPESSFTTRVRPSLDYAQLNRQMQAHIFYQTGEMPEGVKLNEPFGLASWASSQEEANRINGGFGGN